MIPYKITNKLTGEIIEARGWTSDKDYQEFLLVNGTTVRFNRPEQIIDSEHMENDEYTAVFTNPVPATEPAPFPDGPTASQII